MRGNLRHERVGLADLPLLVEWWREAAGLSLAQAGHWHQHQRDFLAQLHDPSLDIYKIVDRDKPIGMVRAELSVREWELQWYVDPACRGRQLAVPMVATVLQSVKGCIAARIKPDNAPSLRVARALGFQQTGKADGFEVWRRYGEVGYHLLHADDWHEPRFARLTVGRGGTLAKVLPLPKTHAWRDLPPPWYAVRR